MELYRICRQNEHSLRWDACKVRFDPPLLEARLVRRYKRFLADIEWPDGRSETVFCPDPGRMTGLQQAGSHIGLYQANNRARKYTYTWEMVKIGDQWVGVNPVRANDLVYEAICAGAVGCLNGYAQIKREPPVHGGRLDLYLSGHANGVDCYVENKSVTAVDDAGIAMFPDAVSKRAVRHLCALTKLREAGFRAVMCWCVQRSGITAVRPADEIDPEYGRSLRAAVAVGVELIALTCTVSPRGIRISGEASPRL